MTDTNKIVDMARFKARVELARNSQDFGERLSRIRASLEKINSLMRELRELSEKTQRISDKEWGYGWDGQDRRGGG